MLIAREVRMITLPDGRKAWEVFTTPKEVQAILDRVSKYPDFCLTIVEGPIAVMEKAG